MRVAGLGAGGHAKVVIEILRGAPDVEIVGLLDPNRELWGHRVLGVPVLGGDGHLDELMAAGVEAVFIGLGCTGDSRPRRRLYDKARALGLDVVAAIHPQAVISPSAEIGPGPTVMARAVINASARLGENVIINTAAVVEHDCQLGDHVHIATGAKLASSVRVGGSSHVGAGATVLQCVHIGEGAVVGAGAVVCADVPAAAVVVGVPARELVRKAKSACAT